MNEAHAAQVRELELFTVDYFAPPPRRTRVLRLLADKKIRDTIEFQGSARDTLDAIWQAVGRPTGAFGSFAPYVVDAQSRWHRSSPEAKVEIVRWFIRKMELSV